MWHRIQITPSNQSLASPLSASMFAAGAEGLHEDGENLVTHLPPDHDPVAFIDSLRMADPALRAEHSEVDDVDWSSRWRDRITSHRLGALTVMPPWLAEGADPSTTVVIEPAMAFGTGEHPTTRGVIRLMQDAIVHGDSVADLGAGSAILSIAAAKLGATRVFAIESDHDAIGNAEENVDRNGVGGQVVVLEGDATALLPVVAPVRIILANIISSVLVDLFGVIAASLAPGGIVILSGILGEERERMLGTLAANGFHVDEEDRDEQWWSVRVRR